MKIRRKNRGKTPEIDWYKYKAIYMSSNISLRQMGKKYKLNEDNLYKQTIGWYEEREKMKAKAVENVKRKVISRYEKFIDKQRSLLELSNDQCAELFKRTLNKKGKSILTPLNPEDLLKIANVINTTLRSFRTIEDKDKGEGDANTNNYWLQLVKFVRGESPIIPEQYQKALDHGIQTETPADTEPDHG